MKKALFVILFPCSLVVCCKRNDRCPDSVIYNLAEYYITHNPRSVYNSGDREIDKYFIYLFKKEAKGYATVWKSHHPHIYFYDIIDNNPDENFDLRLLNIMVYDVVVVSREKDEIENILSDCNVFLKDLNMLKQGVSPENDSSGLPATYQFVFDSNGNAVDFIPQDEYQIDFLSDTWIEYEKFHDIMREKVESRIGVNYKGRFYAPLYNLTCSHQFVSCA